MFFHFILMNERVILSYYEQILFLYPLVISKVMTLGTRNHTPLEIV